MGGKWSEPRTLGKAAVPLDPKKLIWFYKNVAYSELERAQSQLNSQSVKLNRYQCEYLVNHLQQAVNNVRKIDFCSYSDDKVRKCLGGLKLLAQLAIGVRNFIGECSKEEWIKAATMYLDASVHVAYWRYYLKACTILLSNESDVTLRRLFNNMSICVDKLEEENSRQDRDNLVEELEAIRGEGTMPLVRKLIGRLKTIRGGLDPSLAEELDFWEVESSEVQINRKGYLGSGSFGVVYASKCLGFEVAEKFFEIPLSSKVENKKAVQNFEKEVKNMVRLSHPNVVQILFYAKIERGCSLVVEMMDGNLTSLVNTRMRGKQLGSVPFCIDEAVDVMLQIAEGMYYIHGKNVVHRDLKPDNILFKYFGVNLQLTVKVTDFGESKWVDSSYSTQSIRQNPVGTPRYMAPEARNRSEANNKSDVYSFAMVCYMILTGKDPEISLGEKLLLSRCPDVLKGLITSWWHPKPDRRPRFGKICEQLRIVKFSLSRDSRNVLGQANPHYSGNFSQWLISVLFDADPSKSQVLFYRRQCEYLFEKLNSAVQQAHIHLLRVKNDQSPKGLGIMKFLSRLAKDVEIFIQDCCREEWIVSAIILSNTFELVASIGYNLELCTQLCISSLSEIDMSTVNRDEILRFVQRDQFDLMNRLSMSSMSSSEDDESAENSQMLQRRLETMLASSSETSSSEAWRLLSHNQVIGVRIGGGGAAVIFAGSWLGTQVAMKSATSDVDEFVRLEASIHMSLYHPNIVKFYGLARDLRRTSIIMELMDSNLRTLIYERLRVYEFPFTITESVDIALQVSEAMEHMHRHHIVHRDLKSLNILLKMKKIPEVEIEVVEAKVSDFGLSKRNYNRETYTIQTYNVGTLRWMAPESWKIADDWSEERTMFYPFKKDVYSFGTLCWEILTGQYPFNGFSVKQVRKMVLAGERPQLPDQCPQELKALIERCWDGNPCARPSFAEISRELRQLICFDLREPMEQLSEWHDSEEDLLELDRNLKEFQDELAEIQCEHGFSDLCEPYSDPSASGQYLGSGQSGTIVYKMTIRGADVAQKDFITQKEEQFKDEVRIMARLGTSHPNIIGLKGYAMSTRYSSIVTELMDDDIRVLIRRRWSGSASDILRGTVAVDVMHQIAEGMRHVHARHVVHRDLKAENILIREMNGAVFAKVADFGESIHLEDPALESKEFSNVGTFRWMAPEVMSLEEYDRDLGMEPMMPMARAVEFNAYKIDVYSFGMVCYEMLVGEIPFFEISKESLRKEELAKEVKKQSGAKSLSEEELSDLKKKVGRRIHLFDDVREVIKQVKAGRRPSLPENCSESLRSLIVECWDEVPKNRPSFAEIVERLSNIQRETWPQEEENLGF